LNSSKNASCWQLLKEWLSRNNQQDATL
jgi:hypothetical protein